MRRRREERWWEGSRDRGWIEREVEREREEKEGTCEREREGGMKWGEGRGDGGK